MNSNVNSKSLLRRWRHVVPAALALSLMGSAGAADYLLVVPVKGRAGAATQPAIAVTLNPVALPAGLEGDAYPGFDFNTALQVTGDAQFSAGAVTWSIVEGTLPAGIALAPDGRLTGTPAAGGSATFSVRATYRTKSGQQAYQVLVTTLTVALAGQQLPVAPVGTAYSFNFAPQLTVTGDLNYDASRVSWTTVGALPPGLVLSSSGVISGTPKLNDEGASVTLKAAYKSKSSQQTYTIYPSDPLYSNVELLMHMDGASGSTAFVDAKGHPFASVGSPSISTAAAKYGGASASFSGNSYLKTSYSPAYVFAGDFTVELWANISAHMSYAGLIASASTTSWAGWQIIFDQTSNNLRFEGSGQMSMVSSIPLPMATWAHVALVRQGMAANNVRLYINGSQVAALTYTGAFDSGGAPLYIGTERTAVDFLTGYIDDVRITANAARYTGNFTPPAGSHPSR
jgi:Tfp pilus assembly protein PilV